MPTWHGEKKTKRRHVRSYNPQRTTFCSSLYLAPLDSPQHMSQPPYSELDSPWSWPMDDSIVVVDDDGNVVEPPIDSEERRRQASLQRKKRRLERAVANAPQPSVSPQATDPPSHISPAPITADPVVAECEERDVLVRCHSEIKLDPLASSNQARYDCPCGSSVQTRGRKQHEQSKKHKQWRKTNATTTQAG
jgi:hypothetical protein